MSDGDVTVCFTRLQNKHLQSTCHLVHADKSIPVPGLHRTKLLDFPIIQLQNITTNLWVPSPH
ncbi:hypothetical protein BD779DRAFT_750558 [Infundibulicybe gibba]|nr:hypothetical protein BD779DRAFT_750558 [Infundibulicybe gibba]